MGRHGLLIGEVAARSGLSRKALRLYEARGILPPSHRSPSGYRHYQADVLGLLTFVGQARRVGLTLAEIREIVALRKSGSAPCVHVRALLERRAADLEGMLTRVRRILGAWPSARGRPAVVCPHIEAKGGDPSWTRPSSRSARSASPARKS
jgi:DNA-binding transcriptional MerR regulator